MQFFNFILSFAIIKILLICIILDTIFGVLRAIREHKINSNIGIDGTIRKAGMIIAIIFFYLIDYVGNINVVRIHS